MTHFNRELNILMLRFLIQSKRLTAVGASLRSFKRCSLLMLIPGQVLWHRMGSRYIYNIIRLLLAVVSPISRVCTHEYFFMTCAAYARTRHKRLSRFYASLCSFKSASLLIPGTWKDRKPPYTKKERIHDVYVLSESAASYPPRGPPPKYFRRLRA